MPEPILAVDFGTSTSAAIKAAAERAAGEPVTRVVLTVPGSYEEGDVRRALMVDAATEAGFDVVELLPEPVAAALAPVAGPPVPGNSLILVYDLGGGTFDTALIRIGRLSNEVLRYAAIDHGSGGRDIDSAHAAEGATVLSGEWLITSAEASPESLIDPVKVFQLPQGSDVNCVTFSPDGRSFVTGNDHGYVWVFDRRSGEALLKVRHSRNFVRAVAYSPDGTRLASVGGDCAVIWELSTGRQLTQLTCDGVGVWGISFHPDGRRLAVPGADIRVWDLAAGSSAVVCDLPGAVARFNPDGQRLASAHADGKARIWDLPGGELVAELGHPGNIRGLSFSADGSRILTGGEHGFAAIWDAATGAQLRSLEPEGNFINGVAFSPDGSLVATTCGHDCRICDADSGQELARVSHESIYGLAFSPDGRRLATTSWGDDSVCQWTLR
jgi:WD40 repeat protein